MRQTFNCCALDAIEARATSMARIRSIKPEFFSHEQLASKSAHARLLAIGLLTLADCEGRLRFVPMQVHAQVFPWEALVKIEELISELIEASYLVHYEVGGKRYVQITNFRKHQRLSGKEAEYKSLIPPPPEKPNDSIGGKGEAAVKQSFASQGSGGNPLGTGEHRNIGTGEHRNIGAVASRVSDSDKSKAVTKPECVDQQHWADWMAVRRTKRAGPLTTTAWNAFVREVDKTDSSLDSIVRLCAERSWSGFKAEWIQPPRVNGHGQPKRMRIIGAED